MKILLIDFDSKNPKSILFKRKWSDKWQAIPNLAIMKLSAWHKQKGDKVGLNIKNPDKVYVSVIFSKNKAKSSVWKMKHPAIPVIYGGSGWDLQNALPEEIEKIKPDYDLYPSEYSQGFTTRGCVRKCPFCIVPKKEGNIQTWQHPIEFHEERFNTCMLMDNNLLGAPKEWINPVFDWFNETGTKMIDHGFDARLLTEEWAGRLKDIKHPKGLRFAWDNMNDEKAVIKAISFLKDAGFNLKNDISFYVLAGYNTTFEEDLYRCNKLRELGVNAFVMRYHNKDMMLNKLARWTNRRWAYWSSPFRAKDCKG